MTTTKQQVKEAFKLASSTGHLRYSGKTRTFYIVNGVRGVLTRMRNYFPDFNFETAK